MTIKATSIQKLPKEFQKPHKEKNLLIYKDFEILVATKKRTIVGSIRVGTSVDYPDCGLITDLFGKPDLINTAEKILKQKNIKKVDAYYLDGPGKLKHFYAKGYEPQRRTVEIVFELKNTIREAWDRKGITVKEVKKPNLLDITELFKNSFQPYWVAPQNFANKEFFFAYKNSELIGMVDKNLEIGVVIRKGFGGEKLGTILLSHALYNLKKEGIDNVSTLSTSGLDDYDPKIYLYTMNGGKIIREYINLQKDLSK